MKGYAQFSMRNVAEHAGVYLANVQYYFQTREDLVRALMEHTAAGYLASFEQIRARTNDDRLGRFTAFLDFNLKDTGNPETRRFFIQLWALLSTMDDSGALLKELYEKNIQQFCDAIQDLVGDVDPTEVRRRATTLSALMEGLHVVQGAHSGGASENEAPHEFRSRDGIAHSTWITRASPIAAPVNSEAARQLACRRRAVGSQG